MAGNEIKAAEYRCFDVCLVGCVCVCVLQARALTKVQAEKKRAASGVTAMLVGFANVLSPLKVTHLGDQEAYVKGDFE